MPILYALPEQASGPKVAQIEPDERCAAGPPLIPRSEAARAA